MSIQSFTESKHFLPTVGVLAALFAVQARTKLFKSKKISIPKVADEICKKITVIGASSPTGQWFLIQALSHKHEILATTSKSIEELKKNFEEKYEVDSEMKQNIKYEQANVLRKESIIKVLEGQDVVVLIVSPGMGWNLRMKNGDVFGIGASNIVESISELKNAGKKYPTRIIFIDGIFFCYSDKELEEQAHFGYFLRKVSNGKFISHHFIDSYSLYNRADLAHYMVSILNDAQTFNKIAH